MARRWRIRLLLAVVTVPLIVLGFDRIQMIDWVGSTDLEVEFAVTDARTGAPIPGSRIEIQQSKGGFYEDQGEREFALIAGSDGIASRECRQSMCFGTRSGLSFTDTFVVHLPHWRFRVVSDGNAQGHWKYLDRTEYIQQARPDGPGRAKIVVPVALYKS